MNYRHAFHAGNFADVVKHAVLVRILVHLREKPAPFRVIDTHAGAGSYDLAGEDARRSGEWRDGSDRLVRAPTADRLSRFARARARVPARAGSAHRLRTSSRTRPPRSRAIWPGDRRSKAVAIDGWTALNAYVPPKERRGLVLVDPAFEDAGDFARLAQALAAAHRQWASGTYLAGYPSKELAAPDALAGRLRRSGVPKILILRAELGVAAPRAGTGLGACAVDARRRACNPAAGACGCPVGGGRGCPLRRLARRRKVVSPLF